MQSRSCVFCGIVKGAVPAYKIYEDKNHIAFLDIFPNIEGQAVMVPKKHAGSIFSDAGDRELANMILSAKKVCNLLRRRLGVQRVNLVLEGTGVDHLHAKLYPTAGVRGRGAVTHESETVYFPKYKGYVTTLLGPRASGASLKKLQKKITGRAK